MNHHGSTTSRDSAAPGRIPATAAPVRDFAYDPWVGRTFPALRVLACVVDLPSRNDGPSGDDINAQALGPLRFSAAEHLSVVRSQEDRLAESSLDSIKAWRAAFAATGVRPTQYRCAAESLLRRLRTHGDIPQLHPLVDLGNALSVRWAVPVAVIDLDRVQGSLRVTRAVGEEEHETFAGDIEHPEPGEVVYVDDGGHAHSRRWCWRQSARSVISPATRRALVVLEALHEGAEDDLSELAAALVDALSRVDVVVELVALSEKEPALALPAAGGVGERL